MDELMTKSQTEEISYQEISGPAVMAKQPLVSVKMLTYNHEPYIAKAIAGVLMQETNFPIELIIGEDCSTDRTREIVIEYQRKRPDVIRLVLWDKNVGPRKNSNKLNELLRGKYVAFCEGDDYWTHPKKLQMQVDIMESNPEIGLVFTGGNRYNVKRERLKNWHPLSSDEIKKFTKSKDLLPTLIFNRAYPPFLTASACMRRDLFLSILKNNPDDMNEEFLMRDAQLWVEASRMTKMYFINQALVTHNIIPGSLSHPIDPKETMRFKRSGRLLLRHLVMKSNYPKEVERTLLRKIDKSYLKMAFEYLDKNSVIEAKGNLDKLGYKLNPIEKIYYYCTTNNFGRTIAPVVRYFLLPNFIKRRLYSFIVNFLNRNGMEKR